MSENLVLKYAPEYWRPIPGYANYEVSNYGNVRSLDRVVTRKNGKPMPVKGQLIKPQLNRRGYLRVRLKKDKKEISRSLHRLVAEAFIPNPLQKPQVNHINGIKTDNNVNNLEWLTAKENMAHAVANGLVAKGERQGNSKLTSDKVVKIKQLLQKGKQSLPDIAKMFNVGLTTIHDIKSGKQWKHI